MNCQYPFERQIHAKAGENKSSGFREEGVYTILYTFIAQGQGQITPGGQN